MLAGKYGEAGARLWIVSQCQVGAVKARADEIEGDDSGYTALKRAGDFGLSPQFWASQFADDGDVEDRRVGVWIRYFADWHRGVFSSVNVAGAHRFTICARGVRFDSESIRRAAGDQQHTAESGMSKEAIDTHLGHWISHWPDRNSQRAWLAYKADPRNPTVSRDKDFQPLWKEIRGDCRANRN